MVVETLDYTLLDGAGQTISPSPDAFAHFLHNQL
jgi:hypothetical protein